MALTNAFDIGPCTITVKYSVNVYFSGILGKGDTSDPFNGLQSDENLTVSVTDDGDVQLIWISGNGPSHGYILSVIPTYDPGTADAQVAGIVMPDGISGSADAFGSVDLSTADGGETWTPDPAMLSGGIGSSGLSVYMGNNS